MRHDHVEQLRRVRRLSTAQRSDALFGQDTDADSFGGYNGHVAWMRYKGNKWHKQRSACGWKKYNALMAPY